MEAKGEGGWGFGGFNVRMVLLLLIPEKRERRLISYRSISHSWWDEKGGELSVRAKALSVEIALTEDDMICEWGNGRCGLD